MNISRQTLIHNFASSMYDGTAALFIGAGMSRDCGFVNWQGLLCDCAKELKLDLHKEHDLVAVAQYYLNRRHGDRSNLNRILKNEFDRPVKATKNHEIIGRIPISTIWTTNFDSLIERSLKKANKIVDIKSRDQDLAITKTDRDVVLYKMHGDIARPDEIIICKEDYERYAIRHPILQNALQSDLVSMTFLFLGFSFRDPNLDYMFGYLHSLLEDSKHEHYAIMRSVRDNHAIENKEERRSHYEYEKNKQDLQIQELQRYSVQTHLIDKYDEVNDILTAIEDQYYRRNVFVSGSANKFTGFGEDRIRDLCMELGERLVENNYKLISGIGLNIGDSIVKGALLKLYELDKPTIEKHILLRPFPRTLPARVSEDKFLYKYRSSMIQKSGFAIFISGTSRSSRISSGVMEEYKVAKELNKIPIPIGATGYAAREIWKDMESHINQYYPNSITLDMFKQLNNPKRSNSELLNIVFDIIEKCSDNY